MGDPQEPQETTGEQQPDPVEEQREQGQRYDGGEIPEHNPDVDVDVNPNPNPDVDVDVNQQAPAQD